ncbi:SDR family NAD(P)-dependent oxidoreductase [Plantactinospora sp. ZYX-F-223]|uniref:type I polyketide synthase n=1 Tax=Plantactinospora sp. ZYX-F-223 TaxID=3144103 RepID=UPI0031FDF64C
MAEAPVPAARAYEDSLDIAIVGIAARFPGAADVNQFWHNLRNGVCSVTRLDDERLMAAGVSSELLRDPALVKAAFLLEDSDLFDAGFFGYAPREAELMDPQHRILLECAWEALESAGCDPAQYQGLAGVYAGGGMSTYLLNNIAGHRDLVAAVGSNQVKIGNSNDFLATRLSYKLGLEGPSINVQSACSSSLVAVALACQGLLGYQCDIALAGGVAVDVLKERGYLYQEDGPFAPDGYCRTFDARARGTVGGDGVGLVVLKRLHDAMLDGDHIHAVIKGSAVTNDGALRAGFTAPRADGQAMAITTALANADVDPVTVQYVEAHGTATILGDPIEFAALTTAYRADGGQRRYCALGSVKPNIGHLDAAAGIAGLIKTVLSVEHGQIPPMLHYERPNPRIHLDDSPFYINTELMPWPATPGPRRAGVSSFGLGGTNAHVVLEQAPERPTSARDDREQLLVVSARSEPALDCASDRLSDYLRRHPDVPLADIAFTLQTGRRPFPYRRVLVCATASDGRAALDARVDGRLLSAVTTGTARRQVAFLFTGFGDQYPQMGRELYEQEPVFRDAIDGCAAIVADRLDRDLRDVMFDDATPPSRPAGAPDFRTLLQQPQVPDHHLYRPLYGYPALFAVEYALVQLWGAWGVRPAAMIGHSLGEYVAACVAGVFSLEDGLRLVVERAERIERLPEGVMLAVPLGEQEARALVNDEVQLAAVNGPRMCVLSGVASGIAAIEADLKAAGIACRRLLTRYAFHSHLAEPAVDPYRQALRGVRLSAPSTRFISNMTGTWITDEQATDPEYWAQHMLGTVRFADGAGELWRLPDPVLVEVGPGRTLMGSALQHPGAREAADRLAVSSMHGGLTGESDRGHLLRTVGQLWLAGVPIAWEQTHRAGRRRIPLPTYPFERRRFWLDRTSGTPGGGGTAAGRRADLTTWFATESWQRLPDRPRDTEGELAGKRWLAFIGGGFGSRLVDTLRDLGAEVVTVTAGTAWERKSSSSYLVDPADASHYERLAAHLRETGFSPERVLHCWTADGVPPAVDRAQVDRLLGRGFQSLVRWAQAYGPELMTGRQRWDVVSTGVYAVLGDEEVCAVNATLQGVCKVIAQEYPGSTCHLFDLASAPEARVDQLLDHLAGPPASGVTAIRGRHAWRPVYVPASYDGNGPSLLRPRGVYLITGGLGKIGLVLARALAESVQGRLVLVGRTGLPPREEWRRLDLSPDDTRRIQAVRELEALGAEVLILRADVADETRMREMVTTVQQQMGPINGVLHCAGSTGARAHRVIADLTPEACDWHFGPKVHGTLALDRALSGQPLDFAFLFSSVASLLGGLGFAAYAAANAFMDALARRPEGRNVSWTSLNWEAWRFPDADEPAGGVGGAIQEMAVDQREGRRVFERLLTAVPPRQVIVSTTDLDERARLWTEPVLRSAARPGGHARPNLRNAYVEPTSEMERRIAGVWQDLLGVDMVGVHDSFFELGGSSLLGLQVVHRLRDELGVAVPLTIVYEGPSVRTLARLLEELGGRP